MTRTTGKTRQRVTSGRQGGLRRGMNSIHALARGAGAAPAWASQVLLAWLPASFILRDPRDPVLAAVLSLAVRAGGLGRDDAGAWPTGSAEMPSWPQEAISSLVSQSSPLTRAGRGVSLARGWGPTKIHQDGGRNKMDTGVVTGRSSAAWTPRLPPCRAECQAEGMARRQVPTSPA